MKSDYIDLLYREHLYRAVACIYSNLHKEDGFSWGLSKDVLKQVNCFELVELARKSNYGEKQIDAIVGKVILSGNLERTICEKIKNSRGIQQLILSELHDAGIADAQKNGSNFILTLDLNEGQVRDGVWYRKSAEITFVNAYDYAWERNEKRLVGLSITSRFVNTVDGNLHFSLGLYDMISDTPNVGYTLSVCCEDVQAKYYLVND